MKWGFGVTHDTKETVYYIASVRLYQVKALGCSILTEEDSIGWLGEDNGYCQIFTHRDFAKKFRSPPKNVKDWDGMPWFCRIKPDSIKVYKVSRKTSVTETVEEYSE